MASKAKSPQSCQREHKNEQNAIVAHLENCFYAGPQMKERVECEFLVNAQAPLQLQIVYFMTLVRRNHTVLGRKSVHFLKT